MRLVASFSFEYIYIYVHADADADAKMQMIVSPKPPTIHRAWPEISQVNAEWRFARRYGRAQRGWFNKQGTSSKRSIVMHQ